MPIEISVNELIEVMLVKGFDAKYETNSYSTSSLDVN